MTSQRRLTVAFLIFGYALATVPLLLIGLFNNFEILNISPRNAVFIFPTASAAVSALLARFFDPDRFGPLRGLALSVVLFIVLCLMESVILGLELKSSNISNPQTFLWLPLVVFAVGGMWFGWIFIPVGLLFGALYRLQTIKRRPPPTNAKPAPLMASAINSAISQNDQPFDETAYANWPLEDMRPDTVKLWASRIVAAYPAALIIAVIIGLAAGYVGGENAQLVLAVTVFLLFPIYVLSDAIFNARFLACALRTCILPIGALWAFGIFGENIQPVVWLIVAAAYLAVAMPTIAITRWHRVSMFGAGNVGLSKWGPKIAYLYLMVVLIFFIYDEAVNTTVHILGITVLYVQAVLVVTGIVLLRRKMRRSGVKISSQLD